MLKSKVGRAISYNLVLNAVHLTLSVGMFLLLARVLSPDERGRFAGIMASVGLLTSLLSFGLPITFSQTKSSSVTASHFLRIAASMCGIGLLVTATSQLFEANRGVPILIFIVATCTVMTDTINKYENYRASYLHSMATNYIYSAVVIAILAGLVMTKVGGIEAVYATYSVASLVVLVFAVLQFSIRRVRADGEAASEVYLTGKQFWTWMISFASVFSRFVYVLFFLSDLDVAAIGLFLTICGLFQPVSIFTVAISRAFYGGAVADFSRLVMLKLTAVILATTAVGYAAVFLLRHVILDVVCILLPKTYCASPDFIPAALVYVLGTTVSQLAIDIASRYSNLARFIAASCAAAAIATLAAAAITSISQAAWVAFGFGLLQLAAVAASTAGRDAPPPAPSAGATDGEAAEPC